MKLPKIIAVDFDGTLVTNKYPDIGDPIFDTIRRLKLEKEAGSKIILWTCRTGKHLEDAINWCADYEIFFDHINDNVPEIIEAFDGESRKIFANEYWDDLAIRFPIVSKSIGGPETVCVPGSGGSGNG